MYRATDEELGVAVAIKLLKRRMASDELAAAQVRDDNLVRVFGTGKLDSTAYIAMERLDGPTSSSTSANIRRSRPCTPRARALRRSRADHRRPRSRSTCRSRPSASRRIDATRARWPRGKREQELVFMQMVSRPFANARSGACLLTESLCYGGGISGER